MTKRYKLEHWSTQMEGSLYTPPELRNTVLTGYVFGHPDYDDGHPIITSSIVLVRGKIIKTKSGSEYELGEIEPEFKKWLDEKGYKFDKERPIKFVYNRTKL